MKRFLFFIAFSLLTSASFSQKYMEKIAEKSCECIDKLPHDLAYDEMKLRVGLCFINASKPYSKKLKKEYGLTVTENIGYEGGRKLGKIIGVKMLSYCPKSLVKFAQKHQNNIKTDKVVVPKLKKVKTEVKQIKGVVKKIEKGSLITFVLEKNNQRKEKLYWFSYVESTYPLVSRYMKLENKTVTIQYEVKEYFDVAIEEYRKIKVMKKLVVNKN